MFSSSMSSPSALLNARTWLQTATDPEYIAYLQNFLQSGGQYVASYTDWKARRAADVARAAEREGWISAQAAEILTKCPTGGWPGPRDGPAIPCSLEEARRRAEWAYMSRSGTMVAQAVPPKATGTVLPQEVTAALEVAPPAGGGGGMMVLVAVGAGLGLLLFFGRKRRRA